MSLIDQGDVAVSDGASLLVTLPNLTELLRIFLQDEGRHMQKQQDSSRHETQNKVKPGTKIIHADSNRNLGCLFLQRVPT